MQQVNVPNHIAFILDGNGRWAKQRLMPRIYGHRKGVFVIKDVAKWASDIGVKYISLYCFSTENWNRPYEEVDYLMKLPIRYFKRYMKEVLESNYRIVFSGRRTKFEPELIRLMEYLEEQSKDKTGLVVNICFDYGSQYEICEATKAIAKLVKEDEISIDDINPELFQKYLYNSFIPPVDLMIRTSGEERLSNYMLWQIAYAELYFTKTLWPDFNKEEFDKAILNYQNRNRRFGGLKENKK